MGTFNAENIPKELKDLPQWVCVKRGNKIPMNARENKPASSADPNTWCDFNTAFSAVWEGKYDYCGFVFANNGLVGIDIDAGFDQDGFITNEAASILPRCMSYTERSMSGRGFHVLLKGDIPFKGKNNLEGIEIYKASRYFIMTGNVSLYNEIIENQPAIDRILELYFPNTRPEHSSKQFSDKIYSPLWKLPHNGRIMVKPQYPQIKPGCRNLSLTSLAGSMHNTGYSFDEIFKELLFVNETKCVPPLDTNEVLTIVKSITRYRR